MTEFQQELLGAIEEVALNKGMDVNDCIRQAIQLTEKEKKEDVGDVENLEEKVDNYYKEMFNERILGYGKGVRSAS